MDLREAKTSLDEYSNAFVVWSGMLNMPQGTLSEAILALGRPAIAKIEALERESAELAGLITKGLAAQPLLASRAKEVLEVNAALHRLKREKDKANEAAERFRERDSIGEFTIDIEQAKAFRDLRLRADLLLRKRYAPTENGRLTEDEIMEAAELDVTITTLADTFVCAPGYDFNKDDNRLGQLFSKRLHPGFLSNSEDEEEARLQVRIAAYWRSPEGRERLRMRKLTFKSLGRTGCSPDEEKELDHLKLLYPTTESPLRRAIKAILAKQERQRALERDRN